MGGERDPVGTPVPGEQALARAQAHLGAADSCTAKRSVTSVTALGAGGAGYVLDAQGPHGAHGQTAHTWHEAPRNDQMLCPPGIHTWDP